MRRAVKTGLVVIMLVGMFSVDGRVYAANYYLDANNGNDNNNGLTPETAWQTLDKINAYNIQPGDQILFKRGCEWDGTVYVTDSGTSSNPIIFDAYGSGDKPVISGDLEVTGWTVYSGNIWQTDVSGVDVSQLFYDGERQTLARYPNTGYLTIDASSVATYVIDYDLTQADDYWNGATIFIRTAAWWIEEKQVVDYENSSSLITLDSATSYSNRTGYGYYLENIFGELDTPGEWYYDAAADKLYFYPPNDENPNQHDITVSVITNGFEINDSVEYVQIKNLNIRNFSEYGIYTASGVSPSYLEITDNCVSGMKIKGIFIRNCSGCNIENNMISEIKGTGTTKGTGISVFNCNTAVITANEVFNCNYRGIECFYMCNSTVSPQIARKG